VALSGIRGGGRSRGSRRRGRRPGLWPARLLFGAQRLEFRGPLQVFVHAHGQKLHHAVRDFEPALKFLDGVARPLDREQDVEPLRIFPHAVGQTTAPHALQLPDLSAGTRHYAFHLGDDLGGFLLAGVRPDDKNHFILSHAPSRFFGPRPWWGERPFAPTRTVPNHVSGGEARRLKRFIAFWMPSPRITRTASAARSTISATASRSRIRKGDKRYETRSSTGASGATPIRTRAKPSAPRAPMMDFSPLCPPALPRARMRIEPSGNSTSSTSTIKSSAPRWCRSTRDRKSGR